MDGISRGTAAFQQGQQVEHYLVVEMLTPTRFGHIYRGRHLSQPIQVLIEGLMPPLLDEFKESFLKGARAFKSAEHPHILSIRDAGVHEHYPFLVTDYLSYRVFSQVYSPKNAHPLATLLPHLKQIASALHYAHSRYIVHGDIRPENILLGADDTPLLRGFLLEAIIQNRGRLNYRGVETVEHDAMLYAAPEQIQGNASFASDQYALGVLIYQILCGKAPFTGSSVEIAFQKMHASAPSLRLKMPGIISRGLEQVVMQALEREPEKRFPDIQAFINALEEEHNLSPGNHAVGAPVQLMSVTTPSQIQPPIPSSRAPVSVSGPAPSMSPLAPQTPPIPPQPAPGGLAGSPPALQQVPTPAFAPPGPPALIPPSLQTMVPLQVNPSVGQVAEEFKAPPRSKPPARRRQSASITRRVFAVGLVGFAALSGAGGWYLLSQRFAHAAPLVLSAPTGLPATQTIVNHQKELIFTGHLASVNALAWSPDGKFIASASDDTFVQIFEANTGKRRLIYRGHTEEVAAVAWSPNGRSIASAGQDRTVQIWSAANGGTPMFTYQGHTDRVNSVSWSNNGLLLASGSDDKSVQVWRASNGARAFTFRGHTAGVLCVSWQPDESSVASGSWDGSLRDWATVQHGDHFNAGDQIFNYGGHGKNEVSALAWSPDSNFIVSAGADQTVQISNGVNGTPRPPFFTGHRRKDHVNRVFAVAWSPDGNSIASGDEDGNVYVWRTAGRKTVFIYRGHTAAVNAVAWSPNGKYIASGSADTTVHVWQPG